LISFEQIPKVQNKATDAMATISSLLDIPKNVSQFEFLVEQLLIPAYDIPESEMVCKLVGSNSPWYQDIYDYLKSQTLPSNLSNNQRKSFI
jgi:hypothetical protein